MFSCKVMTSGALDAGGFGFSTKRRPSPSRSLLQRGGDVGVLAREDLVAAVNDGNAAAEPGEHLAKLEADIAAAENQEMLGDSVEFHDGGVGEIAGRVEAANRGESRDGRRRR